MASELYLHKAAFKRRTWLNYKLSCWEINNDILKKQTHKQKETQKTHNHVIL